MATSIESELLAAPSIVKWAGGKRQLLPKLLRSCPSQFLSGHDASSAGRLLYEIRGRYNERTTDSLEQSDLFVALNRLAQPEERQGITLTKWHRPVSFYVQKLVEIGFLV